MLRHFRVRWWCFATSLALALGTAGAPFQPLLHGDDDHDVACALLVEAPHDASAHRVQNAGASDETPDVHCLACHWARSFSAHRIESHGHDQAFDADLRSHLHGIAFVSSAVPSQLPSRAPPARPRDVV
jgi:hypothetical protein